MRYLVMALFAMALFNAVLWRENRQQGRLDHRLNIAGDKLAVLECSITWNDTTQKIRFSSYSEYRRCLRTMPR